MASDLESVVIIGAGHAGGEVAAALRLEGFEGPVTLIGEESCLPYQRPPLSKSFLAGEIDAHALALRADEAYQRHAIRTVLGARVSGIDRSARCVRLSNDETIAYGRLVLATGGRPRRLPAVIAGEVETCTNFHFLRTVADVERIRPQFLPGARLIIIGGGYIGLEVAAVAVKRGLTVTVLEALPRVLARVTAPEVSAFYESVHRAAGVDVRTSTAVEGFELDRARGRVAAVRTNAGLVEADLVVAGIGLVPNVELAQDAGLEVGDGIVVDEWCVTSDPKILAVGDCTNHPSRAVGRRIRLESVPNAVEQARTAAAWLVGNQRPYDATPWFWSDQYNLKLQMVGLSMGYDKLVLRGSAAERSFVAFYLGDGRVIAADAVSRPAEFMQAKRLVAARLAVDPAKLANESVSLKTLV
jgi:3-phenylpropionate/trans-cinnamate dioxygenase ferredoxin reductase component